MNYFTKRQPENKGVPMKTTVKLFAILASVFAGTTTSLADITTGWLRTSGGTYDFLTSENWAEGNVNGVFSSDLTIGEGQYRAVRRLDWIVFRQSHDIWQGTAVRLARTKDDNYK